MKRDAELAKRSGASGIVLGVLKTDDTVDQVRTREVMDAARGLPATFHLAFDRVPDQHAALDTLMQVGIERVLTKGGARTALDGAEKIRALVDHARERITIMAGGSIRESNVAEIVQRTGVSEIHTRGVAVAEILALANGAQSRATA